MLRIVRDARNTHGLSRKSYQQWQHHQISRIGAIFQLLPRKTTNPLLLSKLASNISCVTIQHRGMANTNLAQDNHPSIEATCFHWWVIFTVTSHFTTTSFFDRHILGIEAYTILRKSFTQSSLYTSKDFISVVKVTEAKVTTMLGLRTLGSCLTIQQNSQTSL